MKTGEFRMAFGLVCVAVGAALAQLVVIGLVGLALLVVAFWVLLRAGVMLASEHHSRPTWRHVAGYVVYAAGVISLIGFALHASALAHAEALLLQRGSEAIGDFPWPWILALSIVPAAILTAGLSTATALPWRRLFLWVLAAWSVPAMAVLLFRLLATSFPITA